jgi:hypothetical protein
MKSSFDLRPYSQALIQLPVQVCRAMTYSLHDFLADTHVADARDWFLHCAQ